MTEENLLNYLELRGLYIEGAKSIIGPDKELTLTEFDWELIDDLVLYIDPNSCLLDKTRILPEILKALLFFRDIDSMPGIEDPEKGIDFCEFERIIFKQYLAWLKNSDYGPSKKLKETVEGDIKEEFSSEELSNYLRVARLVTFDYSTEVFLAVLDYMYDIVIFE